MRTFGWIMFTLNIVCAMLEAVYIVLDAHNGDMLFLAVSIAGFGMCSGAVAIWLYVIRKERSNA